MRQSTVATYCISTVEKKEGPNCRNFFLRSLEKFIQRVKSNEVKSQNTFNCNWRFQSIGTSKNGGTLLKDRDVETYRTNLEKSNVKKFVK